MDTTSGRPQRLPPLAQPKLACPTHPLFQNPNLESSPKPDSTDSAGLEAPRNPLGEIQSPDLLILRTSHHRKEAKIVPLSTFQPPFLSPAVALARGWRLCNYFYPLISGIAG